MSSSKNIIQTEAKEQLAIFMRRMYMNETNRISSITDVILEPIKKMSETLADMTDSDIERDNEHVVLIMDGTEIDVSRS